jgi:excisionase family DNA binding protein
MDRYLTVQEFVALTGYTRQTVTAWCRAGKLKAIQPNGANGSWRIHPKEVEAHAKEVDVTE